MSTRFPSRKNLMNYRSKKNPFYRRIDDSAFTLIEVVMAVTIITVMVATVLTVMNRCLEAAIDNRTKMQAFELARENMENLLALNSVSDQAEFGTSEKNPDIQWTTVVETFDEPTDSEMWVQAVCSATYVDSKGEEQSIELTHWLSEVPKNIQKLILAQRQKELELMDEFGIPGSYSDEQIAEFAVDMDISVRDATMLLENMTMLEAAKVIALAQKTGLTLDEAIKALNMSPDKISDFIFSMTGIPASEIPIILDEVDKIPDVFPDPEPVIEPEPVEPEGPEETEYSDWCVSYGLPPDCETWPIDKLLQALLKAKE